MMDALADLDLVVVDESFIDFVDAEEHPSVARDAMLRHNVLVLKSLGKNFGLHGVRFGYVVGNPALVQSIGKRLPKWNLNSMAETVVFMLADYFEDYRQSLRLLARDRAIMIDQLCRVPGLLVYPSQGELRAGQAAAGDRGTAAARPPAAEPRPRHPRVRQQAGDHEPVLPARRPAAGGHRDARAGHARVLLEPAGRRVAEPRARAGDLPAGGAAARGGRLLRGEPAARGRGAQPPSAGLVAAAAAGGARADGGPAPGGAAGPALPGGGRRQPAARVLAAVAAGGRGAGRRTSTRSRRPPSAPRTPRSPGTCRAGRTRNAEA